LEYVYDFNSSIIQLSHVDTNYKDYYEYDGLNRLTRSDLEGKFIKELKYTVHEIFKGK